MMTSSSNISTPPFWSWKEGSDMGDVRNDKDIHDDSGPKSGLEPVLGDGGEAVPDGSPDPASGAARDEVSPEQVYADLDTIVARYTRARRLYTVGRVIGILVALFFIGLSALNMINVFIGMTIPFFIVWFVFAAPKQAPFDFGILNVLLSQRCDPYAYAQGYYKLLPVFKQATNDYNVCLVNIALGTLLQGQQDTMKSYLATADVNKMQPGMLHAYYDACSRYYFALADATHLDLADTYMQQIAEDYKGFEGIADACGRTLENIAVFKAIVIGQPDTGLTMLERRCGFLQGNPAAASPFLWVEYHYLRARLYELKQDYRQMQESCVYVIHNGNTLDYVQQASAMLKRMP